MKTAAIHYRQQRDLLAYYLLTHVKISKVELGKILGVSGAAVSIQFPTKKGNTVR